MTAKEIRKGYAEEWRELRRAIRDAHKSGNYIAAAYLRVNLRLVEQCWSFYRPKAGAA